MGCLFGCFRVAGDGSGDAGRGDASSSALPATGPPKLRVAQLGERRRLPSKNALSAVFLREDEGSRVERATSSGKEESAGRTKTDQELKHEANFQNSCGSLLETSKEIRKGPECTYQSATNIVNGLKVEVCQTPSGSHQGTTISDALSSSWKGCNVTSQHDCEVMSKSINVEGVNNDEVVVNCGMNLATLDSSFICKEDVCPVGLKSSPISTPSKANVEILTQPSNHALDLEELRNEHNTLAYSEHTYEGLNPAGEFENCGISREGFCQPNIPDENPKYPKNDSLVPVQLSISDECSLFQRSEGSVSSCNKITNSMNRGSMEKCLTTEATVHSSRMKVLNIDTDVEFPSLSQWLKPPNLKKGFRDEPLSGDRSHSGKSSEEDRPIIGMVAAHWKDKEPEKFTPKWWDGNGIPNSTNKYKEDQKVSWHATSFEERLEKALSDEKLLSQRNCSNGVLSGVEGEESDTAASNHLYVAAFT